MTDDEEELYEELAERWGVDPEDVEALQEALDFDLSLLEEIPLDDEGLPDDDYMNELADDLDLDISDLYDMYYGYYETT